MNSPDQAGSKLGSCGTFWIAVVRKTAKEITTVTTTNTSPVHPTPPVLMTLEEVARYLRLHTSTIYRLARAGVIPGVKVGGQWRFSQRRVDEWLAKREVNSAGPGEG
jgi:excisionase family DNA binding protein